MSNCPCASSSKIQLNQQLLRSRADIFQDKKLNWSTLEDLQYLQQKMYENQIVERKNIIVSYLGLESMLQFFLIKRDLLIMLPP